MLYNHLFWMTVALFFFSSINLYVYKEYHDTIKISASVIGIIGMFGLIGGFVRLVSLSLDQSWWWFLNVPLVSLFSIGFFSYFFRKKLSVWLGTINILFLPILWWYGSDFNTIISFDWFYGLIRSIGNFF